MEKKLITATEEKINNILNSEINANNLDLLYKLAKIRHMAKEDEQMNYNEYGNYGRRYAPYGEYNNYNAYNEYGYGRRGYDTKYRGHEQLDRMYSDYSRYEEGKRYGANEDTKRSLEKMLRSMEDFARMLKEEAQSQEEVQMIKETAQRIAQM